MRDLGQAAVEVDTADEPWRILKKHFRALLQRTTIQKLQLLKIVIFLNCVKYFNFASSKTTLLSTVVNLSKSPGPSHFCQLSNMTPEGIPAVWGPFAFMS